MIHDGRKVKDPNKRPFSLVLFYLNNKKKIKFFLLLILILAVIFFPAWSGSLIGHWIKDFLGTIINIVKTI